jgi:hypothetical protein
MNTLFLLPQFFSYYSDSHSSISRNCLTFQHFYQFSLLLASLIKNHHEHHLFLKRIIYAI